MFPKAITLALIVLLSSALTNGVRRKSKIDLPIANAAEAPFSDNIALASSNDGPQVVKADDQSAPSALAATEKPLNASAAALMADTVNNENDPIECDPDMIGFEIITG